MASNIVRSFERTADQLRPVTLEVGVNRYAEGSCLATFGYTKVLCTASVEDSVPSFLKGEGQGWVTAEYSMLPRSTDVRMKRERSKVGGRTAEIQRLIGRSIRAIVDFKLLGERTIMLDCDVLQADGGTRTASITGAYVALAIAVRKLQARGIILSQNDPLLDSVAAISVGICQGERFLDLDYVEDSGCDVDMNVVMTGKGHFVEVQGTAENNKPFSKQDLEVLTDLAGKGINELATLQKNAIERGLKI